MMGSGRFICSTIFFIFVLFCSSGLFVATFTDFFGRTIFAFAMFGAGIGAVIWGGSTSLYVRVYW